MQKKYFLPLFYEILYLFSDKPLTYLNILPFRDNNNDFDEFFTFCSDISASFLIYNDDRHFW